MRLVHRVSIPMHLQLATRSGLALALLSAPTPVLCYCFSPCDTMAGLRSRKALAARVGDLEEGEAHSAALEGRLAQGRIGLHELFGSRLSSEGLRPSSV